MVELKIKVGPKGQILIPKLIRDRYSVKEHGYVLIQPREEGILLRGRPSHDEIVSMLSEHVSTLRKVGVTGPTLGELKSAYLEIEFEESKP